MYIRTFNRVLAAAVSATWAVLPTPSIGASITVTDASCSSYSASNDGAGNVTITCNGSVPSTSCSISGPTSIGAAIEGWVDTPYHGAGFVDPTVGSIGFGFALDTSTALFASDGAPALSRWPMPGGVLPSPAMTSGESPEPRTACGYAAGPVGRPIFLTLRR